jgi:ribosomal protein S18 acetylase RimI-like enzyme
MEIRFLEQADIESFVDVLHEMSRHYNGDNASSREVVKSNLLTNILGEHSDVRVVVARIGDRVAGVAMISILYPATKERAQLFMKELYVLSYFRSQGVGRALMMWIARFAVANNCVRFDWTVDADNGRALDFYRGIGATHVRDKLYFRFAGEDLEAFANQDDGQVSGK